MNGSCPSEDKPLGTEKALFKSSRQYYNIQNYVSPIKTPRNAIRGNRTTYAIVLTFTHIAPEFRLAAYRDAPPEV
jgi:hypothetical protein